MKLMKIIDVQFIINKILCVFGKYFLKHNHNAIDFGKIYCIVVIKIVVCVKTLLILYNIRIFYVCKVF